jgi:predicted transcriptional regulator
VKRPPAVTYEDNSLREAADHMVHEGVGRLPVVARGAPLRVTGMLTRSDLLSAHARRLEESRRSRRVIHLRRRRQAAASEAASRRAQAGDV